MANQSNKLVLAVIEDLLFTVKIADAAKRNGLQARFVKTEEDAIASASEKPLLTIVDLNCRSCDPVGLIATLKAGESPKMPVIAFVSHIEGELKRKAHDAGADMVMARSAFSTNLPQILKRHATPI
jgi:CheY-like chemotaxis protein